MVALAATMSVAKCPPGLLQSWRATNKFEPAPVRVLQMLNNLETQSEHKRGNMFGRLSGDVFHSEHS